MIGFFKKKKTADQQIAEMQAETARYNKCVSEYADLFSQTTDRLLNMVNGGELLDSQSLMKDLELEEARIAERYPEFSSKKKRKKRG